jgi:hypothetical protein
MSATSLRALVATVALGVAPAIASAEMLVLECIHQHTFEQITAQEVHKEFQGTKAYYSVDLTARTVLHQDGTLLCAGAAIAADHIRCKTGGQRKSIKWLNEFEIDRTSGSFVERYAEFGPKEPGQAHSIVDADVKHFWDCKKIAGRKF